MAFWMNIHGCQLHPKIAIYVVKQLKNDSYCQGLYVYVYAQSEPERDGLVFNVTIGHDADRQYCTRLARPCTRRRRRSPHALSQAAGLCAFTLRLQSFGKALGRLLLVSRGRSQARTLWLVDGQSLTPVLLLALHALPCCLADWAYCATELAWTKSWIHLLFTFLWEHLVMIRVFADIVKLNSTQYRVEF